MAGTITVDRTQWLGFRWHRHGLGGDLARDELDDLLRLGFQGSRQAGAELAITRRSPRIGRTKAVDAIGPDKPLVSIWSVRGAPHVHRAEQLDFLRDALAPDPADEGGEKYVSSVAEVAAALAAVVTRPTSKADASSGVAAKVPGSLVSWCERCKAKHVPDAMFRAAGLQAQVVLGPEEQRATMLHPKPGRKQEKVDDAPLALARTYLRVNGPTSKTQYRDWLGVGTPVVSAVWSRLGDELVRVQVDGRKYDLPEDLVDAVRKAPAPSGVVLVPPNDPYLRQVDRSLLVPDSKQRQQVWKALSGPGAVLADGEVAGIWRYRGSDREIAVTTFTGLSGAQRKQVEQNARDIAATLGGDEPAVTWN